MRAGYAASFMGKAVAVGQGNWNRLTGQEVGTAGPIESSFRVVEVVEVQYEFYLFGLSGGCAPMAPDPCQVLSERDCRGGS